MIIIRVYKMRMVFICTAVVAALLAPGCTSDDESGEGAAAVIATTGILADVASRVAGPDLEVRQLIPDGSSPHDFSLSAQDRLALEQADLIVANGAGLEAGIPIDDLDSSRWDLTDHAGELREDENGAADPHVWMDPVRVAGSLPSLAEALADVAPEHADAFASRAEAYARELHALDRELRSIFDRVPIGGRELVTSHDSLGYLADRYGLEVVATAFPSSGPESDASAATLDEVVEIVTRRGVPAVFAQEEDDPEALRLVANEAGVTINEELIIESPGSASSYADMLRHDATQIAGALGGG